MRGNTKLSPQRRIAWYTASFVFGIFLIWFGVERNLFTNRDSRTFEVCVFAAVWLLVVGLLRLWARDSKALSR